MNYESLFNGLRFSAGLITGIAFRSLSVVRHYLDSPNYMDLLVIVPALFIWLAVASYAKRQWRKKQK